MGYLKHHQTLKKTLQALACVGIVVCAVLANIVFYVIISNIMAESRAAVYRPATRTTTSTTATTIASTSTSMRPSTEQSVTPLTSQITTAITTPTTSTPCTTTAGSNEQVSEQLRNATSRESYATDYDYFTLAPQNVLAAIQNLTKDLETPINFYNILNATDFCQNVAGMTVPSNVSNEVLREVASVVLQINNEIILADQAGILASPKIIDEGNQAATAIYQALETLLNNLPPAREPYIFESDTSISQAHVVLVNSSSEFEDFNFRTELRVQDFDYGILTASSSDQSTKPAAKITLDETALRNLFEKVRLSTGQSSNLSAKFSFSLSAMPVFTFAKRQLDNRVLERPSPLVLLASTGQELNGTEVISIRYNIDKLYKHPFGARRKHMCTFLNYTSQQWSQDGCRVKSKTPDWNGTEVECVCDHLTPFSFLLTLCSSVLGQLQTDYQPYTLDLAIITTATTAVSAVCCIIALVTIAVKTFYGTIVYDEDTFSRTSLWIVLFGMYLFVLFSQSMVFVPDFCGQHFCLATALLVHWFSLMSIAWTAVETIRFVQKTWDPNLYARKLGINGDSYEGFRLRAWIGATCIPIIFPFIASVSHITEESSHAFGGYGYASHEKWCWLDADHPWVTWVTFIVPVTLTALLNILAVAYYVVTMRLRNKRLRLPDPYNTARMKRLTENINKLGVSSRRLHGIIATTGLMGLIWLSAWLALFSCFIDPVVQHVFVLLLSVACISQGVFIIYFQAIIPKKPLSGSQRRALELASKACENQNHYASETYTELTTATTATSSTYITTVS